MTRTELERRLRLHTISLAAAGMSGSAHDRAGNIEIARELLLDEIEKICQEVELHTTMNIAKSVRRRRWNIFLISSRAPGGYILVSPY